MKFLRTLLNRNNCNRSLQDLIRRLPSLTRAEADQVLKSSVAASDWRLTLQLVAERLKCTERDIILKLSAQSQIPYIDPVPEPSNLDGLEGLQEASALRNHGIAPVTRGGRLVAFACVDPLRAKKHFSAYQSVTFCFGTWFQIAKALDILQALHTHRETTLLREKEAALRAEARKVLDFVIAEVSSYGGTEVLLISDTSGVRYEFTTHANVKGAGEIKPGIWQPLSEVIRNNIPFPSERRWSDESTPHREALRVTWCPASSAQEIAQTVIPFRDRSNTKEKIFPPTPEAGTARPDVLIVEDDPVFGNILGKFLKRHKLEAAQVRSGKEALSLLQQCSTLPKLIISDLNMPEMSGHALIAALRADQRLADIPVIILTSEDDVETKLELLESGARIFLSKAEDPRVLALEAHRICRENTSAIQGAA